MFKRALSILAVLAATATSPVSAQVAPAAPPPPAPAGAPAPATEPEPMLTSEPPAALPPTIAPEPLAEPVPAVEPAPLPLEAAPAIEPTAEPPLPKKLSVGAAEGVFQPGLLLQGWFLIDHADETTDTFRLRRAELSAKGEIVPKLVAYGLMADFAKVLEPTTTTIEIPDGDPVTVRQPVSAISALQDFLITFQSEYVDVTVGQYKIPVSYEGSVNSSSKLLFAERAFVSREYGDRRDLGLKLSKAFKYVGYTAGVWNGAGQNNLDNNKGKEVGLRLELYPVEGLLIGGVAYTTIGQRDENGAKDRFEGDLRYERDAFLFQAEYINATDRIGGAKVKGHGFSAALAYGFLDQTLQPVVRVGYLDPNTDTDLEPASQTAKDELFHVDLGVNYLIQKHEAKVLLNYLRQEFDTKKPNNVVVAGAQVAF
ncbi:MAG TPA: hypothetical protein VK509_14085 [Polyangiales bacterium]|nr:hypothetical protein [Polyangiales bacterium]